MNYYRFILNAFKADRSLRSYINLKKIICDSFT